MKNHLRLIAVLFLAGFALLGQSCVEENHPPRPAVPTNITNRQASILQELLLRNSAVYDELSDMLDSRSPLYEQVRFSVHSDFGLCYIVPYLSISAKQVEGAVYIPVNGSIAEDGTVTFDGTLGNPVDMNARKINNDVKFTKRYLYSMPFKTLQQQGLKVDPELLIYAELLDNKTLPIPPEELSSCEPDTKASVSMLEITIEYESEYIGDRTDAVIGMHPDLLAEQIKLALIQLQVNDKKCTCKHLFSTMILRIPTSELPKSLSESTFIDLLIHQIKVNMNSKDFALYVIYRYQIISATGSGSGETGGSSSGGGNSSSGSGNSSSTSPSSFDEPVADTSRTSKRIQSETEELWESLDSIQARTLGINTYISFQTYLDEVAKDPGNEHATLLIDYEDEDHTRVLTEVFHGTEDNVIQTYSSNYVAAQVHNHPNGSPPSAQDLLFTAEMMREENNYQATFVYNHEDKSYYSLYAYEPEAGGNLYQALKNEIDPVTHDFKSGGKCDKILKNHTYVYQDFSPEMEQIYCLCIYY